MSDRPYYSLKDASCLNEIVKNLTDGIIISLPTGEILDANTFALKMFGASDCMDLRKTMEESIVNGDIREETLAQVVREDLIKEFEFQIRALQGRTSILDRAFSRYDPVTNQYILYEILKNITDVRDLQKRILEQNTRDPLTGCLNRRVLEDDSENDDLQGCIVTLIDRLKQYKDRYGNEAAEEVLVKMGRFLSRYVRSDDAVIRTGEASFMILLRDVNNSATQKIARRVQTSALAKAPLSFSMGIAHRQKEESVHILVSRAEQQLKQISVMERAPKVHRNIIRR